MDEMNERTSSADGLREELLEGLWGKAIKNYYEELCDKEAREIAELLHRQLQTGGRRLYFMDAMSVLLPGTSCYYHRRDKVFVLCILFPANETNQHRFELAKDLFGDVTSQYRVFWGVHIGIIGVNKTMRIGQFAIY